MVMNYKHFHVNSNYICEPCQQMVPKYLGMFH
jgi:hypothetical protein